MWRVYLMCTFLGIALMDFIFGLLKRDISYMWRAFLFLALAWLYREADLGWNNKEKNWEFRRASHD